jgi:hypothetical protein
MARTPSWYPTNQCFERGVAAFYDLPRIPLEHRGASVLTVRVGHTGELSDLPAAGGALFASAAARVRTDTIAILFDTNFAEKWASSARFGWGRAAYAFDELRSPLQLPSALLPSQQFLLNRPLLLNVSTSGAAAFLNAPQLSGNPNAVST